MTLCARRFAAASSPYGPFSFFLASSSSPPRLLLSISPSIPATGRRTFQLLRRKTFPPKKTRGFLDLQESLRVRDGLARGVELIYLVPTYRSLFLTGVDRFCPVGAAVASGYLVWNYFFSESSSESTDVNDDDSGCSINNGGNDDNNDNGNNGGGGVNAQAVVDHSFEYVIDEEGRRWKRRKMEIGTLTYGFYLPLLLNLVVSLLAVRFECARTPLRIFYHPSTRHYHAVFPRHWRKERVATFPASKVLLRHGRFRIVTAVGSTYTLANKVVPRHFRDAQHCRVFTKKEFA